MFKNSRAWKKLKNCRNYKNDYQIALDLWKGLLEILDNIGMLFWVLCIVFSFEEIQLRKSKSEQLLKLVS